MDRVTGYYHYYYYYYSPVLPPVAGLGRDPNVVTPPVAGLRDRQDSALVDVEVLVWYKPATRSRVEWDKVIIETATVDGGFVSCDCMRADYFWSIQRWAQY